MKIKASFFVFLFAVLGLQHVSAQSLSGIVVDEYNEPLPYVLIAVDSDENAIHAKATTDLSGQYSLNLKKGTYDVTFSFIGYQTETKSVRVDDKKVVNFTMKP